MDAFLPEGTCMVMQFIHTQAEKNHRVSATNVLSWPQDYTALTKHPRAGGAALGAAERDHSRRQSRIEKLQGWTKSSRSSPGPAGHPRESGLSQPCCPSIVGVGIAQRSPAGSSRL